MSQGTLHSQDYQLRLKKGLIANLEKVAATLLGIQGEPAYTTDTKQLFIHDGTSFQPVQTIDMMVVHNGDFVFHDQEPVIDYTGEV